MTGDILSFVLEFSFSLKGYQSSLKSLICTFIEAKMVILGILINFPSRVSNLGEHGTDSIFESSIRLVSFLSLNCLARKNQNIFFMAFLLK